MCNEKEIYIGKTTGDDAKGFKVRINQHISDCEAGVSVRRFPRNVYDCGIKNNYLEEPFFNLNIMFRSNKSDRLETTEMHISI